MHSRERPSFPPRRVAVLLTLPLLGVTQPDPRASADSPPRTGGPPVIEAKYKVRVERNVTIPVRDGTKLAAERAPPGSSVWTRWNSA